MIDLKESHVKTNVARAYYRIVSNCIKDMVSAFISPII